MFHLIIFKFMKTIIIRVFQAIFAFVAFGLAILAEDFGFRGFGMISGMALLCIGLIFEHISDCSEEHYFSVLGCIFYFMFLFGLAFQPHFLETEDGVDVLSPFYTHVLEHGERLQQKELNSHYTKYYSGIDVKKESFNFLYGDNGTTCSVYNSYEKIMTLPASFVILEKDFGHGKLHYIQVGDTTAYDMHGVVINESYEPDIEDITPDYTNYANL